MGSINVKCHLFDCTIITYAHSADSHWPQQRADDADRAPGPAPQGRSQVINNGETLPPPGRRGAAAALERLERQEEESLRRLELVQQHRGPAGLGDKASVVFSRPVLNVFYLLGQAESACPSSLCFPGPRLIFLRFTSLSSPVRIKFPWNCS